MRLWPRAALILVAIALIAAVPSADAPAGAGQPPEVGTGADSEAQAARPGTPRSFSTVRRWLYERVFHDRRTTLYCGCAFDEAREPDLAACGYEGRTNGIRARRVEVEHVIPASWIGRGRPCWEERICLRADGSTFGGRACCLRVNDEFRVAHNDLHNLWPAIGEINADRGDYAFAEIEGEAGAYGACDIVIDREAERVRPREEKRGNIARMALYMERTHGVELTPEERALFLRWHRDDPPDDWERDRDRRIEALQGNANIFLRLPVRAQAAAEDAEAASMH